MSKTLKKSHGEATVDHGKKLRVRLVDVVDEHPELLRKCYVKKEFDNEVSNVGKKQISSLNIDKTNNSRLKNFEVRLKRVSSNEDLIKTEIDEFSEMKVELNGHVNGKVDPDTTENENRKRMSRKVKTENDDDSDVPTTSKLRKRNRVILSSSESSEDEFEETANLQTRSKKRNSTNEEKNVNLREAYVQLEDISKKRKLNEHISTNDHRKSVKRMKQKPEIKGKSNSNGIHSPRPPRCNDCCQLMDENLKLFVGMPSDALEELQLLIHPLLNELAIGAEDDWRPQHKITDFTFYDKRTHIAPFDTGLVDKNKELFVSGYVKPLVEDEQKPEVRIPATNLGPVTEWWIAGYDAGHKAVIGFTTAYADYFLMEPSKDFAVFAKAAEEKIYMSKIVIDFLINEPEATYEDLLNKIQTSPPIEGVLRFTEDSLLRHAQFVVDQVQSFDEAGDDDESPIITAPCMRSLIQLVGVTLGQRRQIRNIRKTEDSKSGPKKLTDTKATTTPLVREIFETFFAKT